MAAIMAMGACSGGSPTEAVTGAGSVDAPVISFPNQILGLTVAQEDVGSDLEDVERPYVDAVALFSLREDDLLRATIQVSRLNRLARPDDEGFRRQVIGQLGSRQPLEFPVENVVVHLTTGAEQQRYAWFEGDGMFVLSVHQEFVFPRTLLRRVIELDAGI